MPHFYLVKPILRLKRSNLTLLFLLFPLLFSGQSLTGLWTGALHNDSSTVRKDQLFEIALTEYKGKVYGYSRSEFIVNDTLYYIIKRVKGIIEGDVCEVTDDEIVSYNFRGRLDKGIKVTSTFRRNESDSAWYLDGTWKTNATKKYYAVTGKVSLSEEKDLTASKLFPHLEELKLANEVAFYKERTEAAPTVKVAKPEKFNTSYTVNPELLAKPGGSAVVSAHPTLAIAEPVIEEEQKGLPAIKKPEEALAKSETKTIPSDNNSMVPSSASPTAAVAKKPVIVPAVETKSPASPQPADALVIKPTTKNTTPATPGKVPVTKAPEKTVVLAKNNQPPATQPTATTNPDTKKQTPETSVAKTAPLQPTTVAAISKAKTPVVDITEKAAVIAGRKSEFSQVVNFRSDSLIISLYDNGEIDGDTVSVFMNGETILSKQGLKSSAIKKTIYITPGDQEDFTLVMFAESLGKYPPNTGLLVIRDGDDVYNLRFSSDFQKNAGIVFRKKK